MGASQRNSLSTLSELFVVIFKGFCIIFSELFEKLRPSRKSVSGKVIVITGGSRGLGQSVAMKFGALGARVVLLSSNQTAVDFVAKEINKVSKEVSAFAYECDVTNESQVAKVADRILREVGPVDILINNAGVFYQKSLIYQTSNQILKTFEVNLLAHFWMIKAFLPSMCERGEGHIVSVSSVAGIIGGPKTSAYCASKFGVRGLMASLEAELQSYDGIHLTTVCPGSFTSGLLKEPTTRFPFLFPIATLEEVADAAVDAILRNKPCVVFPKRIGFLVGLSQTLLPSKVALLWQRFFEYSAENHDS